MNGVIGPCRVEYVFPRESMLAMREVSAELQQCVLNRTSGIIRVALLGRAKETDLAHEALARLTIDDQFVVGAAVDNRAPATAIGQALAGIAALADAAEHAKVRQQHLHVLEQAVAGSQTHGATPLCRDVHRAVGLEQRAQIARDAILGTAPDHFRHLVLVAGAESVVLQKRASITERIRPGCARGTATGDRVITVACAKVWRSRY